MNTIEIARALAAHGETEDARKAYSLVIHQADGSGPDDELEAALYLFENGGDYRVSYATFQSLYNRGCFQEELFDLMVGAFYAPNLKPLETTYRRNCRLLEKYPYLFRKDFPAFEDLPVKLFPYDDDGFLPFDTRENRFWEYQNPNHPEVHRNFFKDLEKPILADDVYSQYELEYLNDNVRRSDWAARENHIYLHYTSWETFCSYLQCLDLRPILKEEKPVFLIGEELSLYPIDFKARFGVDYSTYTVKPFGVREVKKLIWHTQLSAHNGGDFFNEIFYGHPNLLAYESVMFDSAVEEIARIRSQIKSASKAHRNIGASSQHRPEVLAQLVHLRDLTDKDILVALFLANKKFCCSLDPHARIAPALFFQPHFHRLTYSLRSNTEGRAILNSEQYEAIQKSPLFTDFRYIKTVTPMRRPTTSYAAAVKFTNDALTAPGEENSIVGNAINERILNRSFMIDWQDRLYQDSVLVRFEDGKLNPKATFTALAAFLDIPYTESMTYCSGVSGINPESLAGNVRGFDPATVYRTYDDYANDTERYFLEFFMRDAYEQYGYEFHYYDGKPMDEARAETLIEGFTVLHRYIYESYLRALRSTATETSGSEVSTNNKFEKIVNHQIAAFDAETLKAAKLLLRGLFFINRNGQPLRMMTPLKLDPALLEQPLYH